MQVKIKKITDIKLAHAAIESTMQDGFAAKCNLKDLYLWEHSPSRTQMFWIEMEDIKNRDFLYGRLLAIFEKIEESTFGDEKRSTNAQKLWTAYINCPGKIMMTLIDKLQPYKRKLENNKRGSYIYFENLTQNIMMDLMNTEEFETNKNKKLKENFIFGYYYQRNEFFKSNKNN